MSICGGTMASYIYKRELSVFSVVNGLIAEVLLLMVFIGDIVKQAEHKSEA